MIFARRKNGEARDSGPVYLTENGLEALKKRIARLKASLPGLVEETKRIAAYGDRSDSAEYREAKSALRKANAQIISAEDRLRRAVLIKPDRTSGTIQIGSEIALESGGKTFYYEIVGYSETDPGLGRISNKSPLGEALLGKRTGDEFSVKTPAGEKKYKIISVR